MLTPQDFTKQRNEAMVQAVRGLFIINGGGAVALLAFMQAVWKEPDATALTRALVIGAGLLVGGVILAAMVHLFRYLTAFAFQRDNRIWRLWRRAYLFCAWVSLVLFTAEMFTVLKGAWSIVNPE